MHNYLIMSSIQDRKMCLQRLNADNIKSFDNIASRHGG
jgi:hypothetical protein